MQNIPQTAAPEDQFTVRDQLSVAYCAMRDTVSLPIRSIDMWRLCTMCRWCAQTNYKSKLKSNNDNSNKSNKI